MAMLDNTHGQYVQAQGYSSATEADKLRTKVRYTLDRLEAKLEMPRGMTLHGTATNDRHGNVSLYVFLRDQYGAIHPAVSKDSNQVDYIKETVGGKWVRLSNSKGDWDFFYGAEWEARDIQKAIEEYRKEAGQQA